jgi:ABC-2 type transport system permease protein
MLLRTLKSFWLTSLASEMEYRVNFVTATISSLGMLVGTVFTVNVLYDKNYQFAHWSREQSYLVVALFTLMEGVTSSCLSPNLSKIVQHVQRGTLDFILLKPLDAQVQLSTRNMSPWGFPNILLSLGLMGYAGMKLGLAWHQYVLGIVPVLLAVVILYSLWFMVGTTTVWFTKIWNATEVLRGFLEAGKYPIQAYKQVAVRFFFTYILPVVFITTIPAEVMLGKRGAQFILVEAAIAGALLVISRAFWKWAMRSYTSASS